MRAIEFVREHGYLCRYNLLFPGVGAISCPLPDGAGERLAVTVAGSAQRIQRRGRQIINALLQEVSASARSAADRRRRTAPARLAAVLAAGA